MKQIISAIIIAIAIIGVGVFGIKTFAGLEKQKISNEARYQCSQSSRYMTKDSTDNDVWYPITDMYKACLQEKGIQ